MVDLPYQPQISEEPMAVSFRDSRINWQHVAAILNDTRNRAIADGERRSRRRVWAWCVASAAAGLILGQLVRVLIRGL